MKLSGPDARRPGAPVWVIVKGVALIATGVLASEGMTFVCAIGNAVGAALHPYHGIGQADVRIMGELPLPVYALFFAAMGVWLVFAARFGWRNRTWLGLSLAAVALIVFAYCAVNVLMLEYPVCNAM